MLNDTYAKFYNPSKHSAVLIIVLFKGRVIFRQYIPKKHKMLWYKDLQIVQYDWLYL
jgi:hypothetical protein